ncbi:alpha-2-macroglobulin family protein [Shinella daejeonensis]|uniref:alpha-2-macroglobulin family protein n=1 Tax=Shinella daejeonensis TaxID=659017 RepID=UPI0020C7842A|nr:alpha-2-macroglobulin family protein [Shinella daejeonensis]MCP8896243.1 alpha-2-macroglobulin family protein [Shinella daejeonensis]
MSRRAIFGFSALLLTAFTFCAPPAMAQESRSIVTTENADYFGFDLRTVQEVTLDQCKRQCIDDLSCRAFTYNPKVKWCFLKSDFNQLNPFAGAVAGRIVLSDGEADIGAPPALPFLSEPLLRDARTFRNELARTPEHQDQGVESLASLGRIETESARFDQALIAYRGALSLAPDDLRLWIETAEALGRATNNSYLAGQGALAAINAYQLSRSTPGRARALAALGRTLEVSGTYRAGIEAYKASLALKEDEAVRSAYLDLRARQGFRVVNHTIDSDSATPRACVEFSEPLLKVGGDYEAFVTLDGATPRGIEAKDRQICIEGLNHGQRYRIALRAGLPSSVDEPLAAPVDLDIYVQDRAPAVRFTGDSFVLPGSMRRGIPIVSVNTESADLKLYRIGDRAIAPLLADSQFLTQLDGYSAGRIESQSGELVWQGEIGISPELNKDVVTSFPVDEALPERKPGVYVLTAAAANAGGNDWDTKATQWFVVSDVGLSTYAGTDGLNVFARSLDSAAPLEGVTLQLIARNNEVLGTATTDANGRATFTAGLIRGTAALTPAVILARKGPDDFVFLDMTRAGFDLSDRGVTGRPAPGAIDVLAFTERGIYRAGETVHATALARDIEAAAIEKLPLTFLFNRPDGVEDRRMVSDGAALGGHAVDLALQPNSMRGTWTMQVFADPKGQPLAEKQFLVDDFVPDRIEFTMTSATGEIAPGEPTPITVEGRYLYGAPGAGLAIEGDVALKPTRQNAAFPDYLFGLADEEAMAENRVPLEGLAVLDDEGRTSFDVTLDTLPSTTQRLEAIVTLRMREAGGRAVERALTLPVEASGPMIGVKPEFSGDLSENSLAGFHVVAVSPDGAKEAMAGVTWKLLSVERNYQWYREGSSWRYEPVLSTKQIADGTVDLSAGDGRISVPVSWGRYRLEVESAEADGAATSVEFDAGWYVAATSTETPDALEISLDKARYTAGETARLKVSPRHAGELLVTVGTESLIATQTATIGEDGGEVEIPVTGDWGAGAYVTATLFRPGAAQQSRMPMRAIGITWLAVDPGERKLAVALDAPEKTLPRQPLDIALTVTGAGAQEDAYVTVAAVDVGILNLTRYETPDPEGWYFGQRRLGMEIRDLYGRLIDGSLGATGRLRTGGDGGQGALEGSPPTEKLVAFFSGPVKLDADGKAKVSFDIPQFNGTARIMAVAWTKTGVGHAEKDVVIRDPVVVTASLPKFLAPGDQAELRLDIANTGAPAGDYTVTLAHNASVMAGQTGDGDTVRLEPGGKAALTLPLTGGEAGDGKVTVTLSNGEGLSLEQVLDLPVRPAALPITKRRPIEIAANGSLTIDDQLLADSQLSGASVSLNVSRASAFDIPALLMSLDRYPYGCTEQTASRALPLLYLSELSKQSGLAEDTDTEKRVQEAIYRVLANQSSTGSFGLWGPGYGDLWLDAFITDFLTRAREQKFEVPEQAMVQALANLQNALSYTNNVAEQGEEIAYTLYVLARNRKAAISDLRYYADTKLAEFRTPLARAHLAAALSLYGDAQRSGSLFSNALDVARDVTRVSLSRNDYGSSLRDGAAVLALATETRPVPRIIPDLVRTVANEWDARSRTSTQEQTWMLLAARGVKDADKGLMLEINGVSHEGGYAAQMSGNALMQHPLTVANHTGEPVSAMLTTVAAPSQPPPAGGEGFSIERRYYTLDGEEANITEATQNERYVAVLTLTEENDWPSRILVTDLLPAGFEIDNPSLVDSAKLSNFDWLTEVEPAHTEFRYDRFVAAFNRSAGDDRNITLAYVVRAVTPGTYDHPAAQVEDMYRPQYSARTATGRMQVRAAH